MTSDDPGLQGRVDELEAENAWLRGRNERYAKALGHISCLPTGSYAAVCIERAVKLAQDALWSRTSNDTNWEQAS
jgi:hypothetical protein